MKLNIKLASEVQIKKINERTLYIMKDLTLISAYFMTADVLRRLQLIPVSRRSPNSVAPVSG